MSRSGFHAWLHRVPSKRTRDDETIGAKVRASFTGSDRTYGARRVWRDVLAEGLDCGLHRIERLMKAQALRARPRRRGLPKDDGQRSTIAPNTLDRELHAEQPNQRWIAEFASRAFGSLTSGRPRVGFTSLPSSTCSPAVWSAGR